MRNAVALSAAALVFGAVAAAATTASASTGDHAKPICGTWTWKSAVIAYPGDMTSVKPEGSRTDGKYKVVLVKPTEVVPANAGVEFAARNLDISGPVTVTVKVDIGSEATADSGAVRMFGYSNAGANTLLDPPTYTTAATGDGNLTFDVPAGSHLRVLGFTYDASNPSKGEVSFSFLKIGKQLVSFKGCPEPTATPTATPTANPTTNPPTAEPTDEPTGAPGAGDKPTLPKTGFNAGDAAKLGGGVLLVGAVFAAWVTWYNRRRRPSFKA
jgi:hypothetical protein